MSNREDGAGSENKKIIQRGETYEHAEHGTVEVVGIWRGVKSIDEAYNMDEEDDPVMIVCYTITDGKQPVAELTDTLDAFLAAIA